MRVKRMTEVTAGLFLIITGCILVSHPRANEKVTSQLEANAAIDPEDVEVVALVEEGLREATKPVDGTTPVKYTPETMLPETSLATEEPTEIDGEIEAGEAIWTGWGAYESGEECWEQTGGDGGNAFGRFQIDARHSLAAFLRYAAESDERFVGLERYYAKNGDETTLKSLDDLAFDWTWLCAVYGQDFYRTQAEFAYGMFYLLMRDELKDVWRIDLENYGPVLKGTVWSVAVRNGNCLSSIYSVTDTYYAGIGEEEWLRKIYAVEARRHPDQEKRWREDQLNAALETLHLLESGEEVEFYETFEKDAGQDLGRIELLELDGDYKDFVRYTGRIFE